MLNAHSIIFHLRFIYHENQKKLLVSFCIIFNFALTFLNGSKILNEQ